MPLNIKELHVKMVVKEAESESTKSSIAQNTIAIDEDALIAKCVAQVFQILNDQEER